jgi:hypothetical protein
MSHNDDNSGMVYFGGVAVALIMVVFVINALKAIMNELSILFTAIAKMTFAFISMAFNIAQVLGLLALGCFSLYAAWI